MSRVPIAAHWGAYLATVEDGRLIDIGGVPQDPDPSPIGRSLLDAADATVRVRSPAVRRGYLEHGPRHRDNRRGAEPFVDVSWNLALELVAHELARVRAEHGDAAVYGGSYGWASAGRFHHAQSQIHRFLNITGGYTASVGNYSFGALDVILPHVTGQSATEHMGELPTWDELAEHTGLVVAFGGLGLKNAQVSPGGVGRHETREGHRRCRDAGVRFISVSPVRDDAAAALDARWLGLRPGTDAALMLGLAHTIVSEGRHDTGFLELCCTGFRRFRSYLEGERDGQPKDAHWAARICGLDPDVICWLARSITAERTLITVSWSLQRAGHGEQPCWLAVALAATAGQLGRPGGGCALGFSSYHTPGTVQRHEPHVAALPQGENRIRSSIPVARVADMLLHPGDCIRYNGSEVRYPDVRLIYWCGGNPFHHHQDLNRLRAAWQVPETIIVHEPFWNALARHADIVLPCTTTLERDDFARGMGDAYLLAMHKAIEPFGQARDDFAIFADLARHLGCGQAFTEGRSAGEWVRHLYEQTRFSADRQGVELPDFETFWADGSARLPEPPARTPLLRRLREDPGSTRLATPSGRVEIFSERIDSFGYPDCPGHPVWLEPPEWLGSPRTERHPLHLLTAQPARRLHGQYDHGRLSREGKVAGREPIAIHPDDAEARGIADGDVVRVFNDRGACLAGAALTDGIRRGVVKLATGAWYDPVLDGAAVGLDRHGNPNVLTIDVGTSQLAQACSAQSCLVEVERYEGEPPAVQAFTGAPR